jgi:hypothetical protein
MSEVTPSNLEREIILAMAARDDTGSWSRWVTWRLASRIILPVYCIAVGWALVYYSFFWLGKNE